MDQIFFIVYRALVVLSEWTGQSYNEINIIVYYVLTPFVFFALIDKILKKPITTVGWTVILIFSALIIDDFSTFSDQLFDGSVLFLRWFSIIGIDYVAASVLICVFLPACLFVFLVYWAFPGVFKKSSLRKGRIPEG